MWSAPPAPDEQLTRALGNGLSRWAGTWDRPVESDVGELGWFRSLRGAGSEPCAESFDFAVVDGCEVAGSPSVVMSAGANDDHVFAIAGSDAVGHLHPAGSILGRLADDGEVAVVIDTVLCAAAATSADQHG
jgi:hypothetical protein